MEGEPVTLLPASPARIAIRALRKGVVLAAIGAATVTT